MKLNISSPIVVVDDDEDDHYIFKSICDELGVCEHLKHFRNGFEFLSYLKTTSDAPFIILCDINMPGMDGLQLRVRLNEDEELRNKSIPFIFFSTSATKAQVKKAYDLTVQGFFLKGNSFSETQEKFKHILQYWSDCRHPNSN